MARETTGKHVYKSIIETQCEVALLLSVKGLSYGAFKYNGRVLLTLKRKLHIRAHVIMIYVHVLGTLINF